ncbi:glycosyltransferase family 2 protein, partial [bacterium]|nr:glycosyltransferase family 2 protein [bacterium]
MGLISLITPHADRPEAIKMCEQQVRRFQIPEGYRVEWVLVDGGTEQQQQVTADVYVHHRAPQHPAQNLCSNFLRAIKVANGEFIVVIEDDDWYHPEYLCHMVQLLKCAQMAGLTCSRYYHLGRRQYRVLRNSRNSSLCSTGFRSEVVPEMVPRIREMIEKQDHFLDLELWRNFGVQKLLSDRHELSLGIKGMPGKAGLSAAHRSEDSRWIDDPECDWLREYIGEKDYERYRPFIQPTRAAGIPDDSNAIPVHWRKGREFNFGDRMAAVVAEHVSGCRARWTPVDAKSPYYTTVGSFLEIVNRYAEVWGTGLL